MILSRHSATTRTLRWSRVLAAAAVLVAAPGSASAGGRSSDDRAHWTSTWGASPQVPGAALAIDGQTLRQIAHVSIGGESVRVRLSNAFGTSPLSVTEARIAISAGGSAIIPNTDRALTFGGSSSTTIPAGALAVSDPVDLEVPPLANLAVSLYFAGKVSATTEHSLAVQTTHVSPAGNFTGRRRCPPAARPPPPGTS